MDAIAVRGGKRLSGRVKISGAKNAVLPQIFATLLTRGTFTLKNVPPLRDVNTALKVLATMGATYQKGPEITIDTSGINSFTAPYDLVSTMRASVLALGPLIARYGEARVSLPGGCAIGLRPVDQHLKSFKKMGALVEIERGYITLKTKRLKGCEIHLDMPTVTGTENILMAAVLAKGRTTIINAAMEPEVVDLADMLSKMGANISGAGSSVITVEGVEHLEPVDYTTIPDRIEAGTYMVAAALTGGDVEIQNVIPAHLGGVITKLREFGQKVTVNENSIMVQGQRPIQAANITTWPYPGFPTDLQAQFVTLAAIAEGTSFIRETVFENRFMHVYELNRMGADIKINNNTAEIKGVEFLQGARVMASDLRASASLVLAGLVAKGDREENTIISRVYHIDRGYVEIEKKLSNLGAEIKRLDR